AKFNEMIEKNATDVTMNDWGKRKLAYAINYETEGNYVLWNFTSDTTFPAELERVLKITDGVLRFLVTVK
ncbi:MAG: 30S ribosomal protein S6, partial [Oscillospiraceae bacterium]